MADRPSVAVFDVNETLYDMAPLAQRFADVGSAPQLARTWFASLLRDGFALAAFSFAAIGNDLLRTPLVREQLNRGIDEAVDHVMSGFQSLEVRPDVPEGVRRLRQGGVRLVTLSNGAIQVADGLLTQAGVRVEFEQLLSVEDAGIWTPARGAYEYAAQACQASLQGMVLVAAHRCPNHQRLSVSRVIGAPSLGALWSCGRRLPV
jgi:2-haloacid dehalogenase